MDIGQKLCVLKQTTPDFSLCSYIEDGLYIGVQPFYRLSFHCSQPTRADEWTTTGIGSKNLD